MTNKLLEFISEFKNGTPLPEKEIQPLDYKEIIQQTLSEEYKHPLQKDFIFKEIELDKPTIGRAYSWLKGISLESLMMRYHLYDTKLKKGYHFECFHLRKGMTVSILDKKFIELLPENIQSIYIEAFGKNVIPFYHEGDIYTLTKEYFKS